MLSRSPKPICSDRDISVSERCKPLGQCGDSARTYLIPPYLPVTCSCGYRPIPFLSWRRKEWHCHQPGKTGKEPFFGNINQLVWRLTRETSRYRGYYICVSLCRLGDALVELSPSFIVDSVVIASLTLFVDIECVVWASAYAGKAVRGYGFCVLSSLLSAWFRVCIARIGS